MHILEGLELFIAFVLHQFGFTADLLLFMNCFFHSLTLFFCLQKPEGTQKS